MSVIDGPGEGTWSVFAMQVVEERDRLRERVAELESQLEDADLVMQDALGHTRAAAEGWQTEYLRLDRDLDKIALALGVAGVSNHGHVNTRPSVERMVEEIEARRAAAARMVLTVQDALAEYERHERHHRRYNAVFERHLKTGCDVDEAHRRTQEELTKGAGS